MGVKKLGQTLCIIGNARVQNDNPITHQFSSFFITFVADSDSGEIIDLQSSMTLSLTSNFVHDLFVGHSLAEIDEGLLGQVRSRYLGSSQKAIQVAYRDAVKKYKAWKKGLIITE